MRTSVAKVLPSHSFRLMLEAMKRSEVWLASVSAAIIATAVFTYLINPYHCPSYDWRARIFGFLVFREPSLSMWPTIAEGSEFFVNVATLRNRDPHIGEIIVFKYPPHPSVMYLQRVVAAGGAVVEIRAGELYVDGQRVEEEYLPAIVRVHDGRGDFGPFTVPPDSFFMLGDNRDNSADSRMWGAVSRQLVIGSYSPLWNN